MQNNTNFNTGPMNDAPTILNIQPVIPFEIYQDWNLITRTILPLIWQPAYVAGRDAEFGLGDGQFSAFLSTSEPGPGGVTWGGERSSRCRRAPIRNWATRTGGSGRRRSSSRSRGAIDPAP